VYLYCAVSGGSRESHAGIQADLAARGVPASTSDFPCGRRLYRVAESDVSALRHDKFGPFIAPPGAVRGHSLHRMRDADAWRAEAGCTPWEAVGHRALTLA